MIVNLSDGAVSIPGFGVETNLVVGAHQARDGWGTLDSLTSIESARGSNFNDLLIGAQRAPSFIIGELGFFAEDRSFLIGRLGNDTLRAATVDDGVVARYNEDISGIIARLDIGQVLDGFGFTDTLINIAGVDGSDFDDLIIAGPGGAWMRGRLGDDTMEGAEDGFDTVNYGSAASSVVVNLLTGIAQDGDGGTDSLSNIDAITGSAFADTLIGGDDGTVFFGSSGADSIVGGAGQDGVNYYGPWSNLATSIHNGVIVNLDSGLARDGDGSSATGSLDRLISIEHAVGSYAADTLIGSAGANTLAGAEGDDSLSGGGGNDTMLGGAGADTLDGGTGNDIMMGDGGDDTYVFNSRFDQAVESAGGGFDTIVIASSFTLTAEIEGLVLASAGAYRGVGNALNNSLAGNAGNNTLEGAAGNDSMDGGGGNESLIGDAGNDLLVGGAGADTLFGGIGADTLTGGTDADVFRFTKSSDSLRATIDRVTDMQAGVDDIAFAAATFTGFVATSVGFNGIVNVASANLGAGNNTYLNVMNGANAGLGGTGNVTASGPVLQVWQVNVLAGTAAGSYLLVNDSVAGASTLNDMLIGISPVGALSAGDFLIG